MATNTLPGLRAEIPDDLPRPRRATASPLVRLLLPLASLRLTVVLLAMAIFLVFAGTLAQTEKDILEVLNQYFRTPLARIDFSIFFPKAFFPDAKTPVFEQLSQHLPEWLRFKGFYFPGGFSIGAAMFVNLLAAHGLRFKIQSRGTRLAAGLATIAAGIGLTWLVVVLGPDKQGFDGASNTNNWSSLWIAFRLGLTGLCLLVAYGFWKLDRFDSKKRLERVGLGVFGLILASVLITLLVLGDQAAPGGPSMRILWQLLKGGTAGLVLLAGCILVFRKRAGIVLLHAGIALMMANELVVYGLHSEGQMQIAEGETVDFTRDIRNAELAVSDPSDPKFDAVTAIPRSKLLDGAVVRDDRLPFDVKLVKYYKNAKIVDIDTVPAKSRQPNLATAAAGLHLMAIDARASAGTDMDSKADLPAAYVEFLKKGTDQPLATYLVGEAVNPQRIVVDGKRYDVSFRYKRDYKPYSVFLYEVKAEKHPGTTEARSYASTIRLVDERRDADRKIRISMNNPLRYAGETFYQSQYTEVNPGLKLTTLQVVANTGWMIPYVGCMIVAIGMFAQFSLTLLRFLTRRGEEEERELKKRGRARGFGGASRGEIWAPVAAVALAAIWLGCAAFGFGKPHPEMDLYHFGGIPVMNEGRLKPFDTLARNTLCVLSDYETVAIPAPDEKDKDKTETISAMRWLLDVINKPEEAKTYRVFRIRDLNVLQTLRLEPRAGWWYSFEEIKDIENPHSEFRKMVNAASAAAKEGTLTSYQRKLLELDRKHSAYERITYAFDPNTIGDRDEQMAEALLVSAGAPLAIPPLGTGGEAGGLAPGRSWIGFSVALVEALADSKEHKPINPATVAMSKMLLAYKKGNAADFNTGVANYRELLAKNVPAGLEPEKIHFEAYFNYLNPFFHALAFYLTAFALAALSWLGWSRPFNKAAFWLLVVAFAVHTFALVSRIYISGRPPVTSLYSSAVFIGWGCVVLGLGLEYVYRLGIGNLIAAATGFATLLIAYFLAADGDTFHVLEAVLDTQFWLATHVTCVTLGYATTFFAGMLGVLYILLGVLTPQLSPELNRALTRMIYGVLCFAIFFSFVGTVLGGLWADDSWGRFWGWDPKENGALIIVLWNALVLHARWGGMVKDRGLATLASVGNIVVGWSWFGVNALGIGLHSYGFKEGVMLVLAAVVAAQLVIIALGCLPKHAWRSFRGPGAGAV